LVRGRAEAEGFGNPRQLEVERPTGGQGEREISVGFGSHEPDLVFARELFDAALSCRRAGSTVPNLGKRLSLYTERKAMRGGVIWTIVGVLLIIALLIYIF